MFWILKIQNKVRLGHFKLCGVSQAKSKKVYIHLSWSWLTFSWVGSGLAIKTMLSLAWVRLGSANIDQSRPRLSKLAQTQVGLGSGRVKSIWVQIESSRSKLTSSQVSMNLGQTKLVQA